MTSQIAVLNLKGVAVASDTVVTTYEGGSPKVLGNVPKIYEIGPDHKVLILHSNNVNINGFPHHVHLSEWFKTLSKPLPSLAAYIDSYRAWTASETRMNSAEGEENTINRMLNDVYYELRQDLVDALGWFVEPEGTDRKKKMATEAFLDERIENFFGRINNLDPYAGLTDRQAVAILESTGIEVAEKVRYIMDELPIGEKSIEKLIDWSYLIIARNQRFERMDSDLGFVGFGSDEAFPSVVRLFCRGIYGGSLRATQLSHRSLEPVNMSSSIFYFAQDDSMWGFVNGLNESVQKKYRDVITSKVEARWGAETEEFIGEIIANEVDAVILDYTNETFVQPLLRTISGMGLRGLADIAESLVGLQATSTYSKPGAATVGGLIEVATIDKVKGVVWHRSLSDGSS